MSQAGYLYLALLLVFLALMLAALLKGLFSAGDEIRETRIRRRERNKRTIEIWKRQALLDGTPTPDWVCHDCLWSGGWEDKGFRFMLQMKGGKPRCPDCGSLLFVF